MSLASYDIGLLVLLSFGSSFINVLHFLFQATCVSLVAFWLLRSPWLWRRVDICLCKNVFSNTKTV